MTKRDISFNVNGYVRVKLTAVGLLELARQHDALYNAIAYRNAGIERPVWKAPEVDAEGWSRWQLHELMQQLGPLCFNGAPVPFETTIIIEQEDVP
jgi:repressor LexA